VTVFIRPVNDDFQLTEELLGLESIHETTKGSDLSETLESYNSDSDQGILMRFFTDTASKRQRQACTLDYTVLPAVRALSPRGRFRPY
jgi:hypothetical protein